MLLTLAEVSFAIAAFNALLFLRNLSLYRKPSRALVTPPKLSVLIPARNEERSIGSAVTAALASRDVELEVIVLDDHSEDRTAAIVEAIAQRDARVRLAAAPPLPPGWCGKQFACSVLAELASHDLLCFLDSDVQVRPEGLARMTSELERQGVALISGFPHQDLQTFFEKLLLPLMHFLLLAFLPMDLMRRFLLPSLGAGCGQLFIARRSAYRQAGGHAAIRASRHDGISLPHAFRRARLWTGICDATGVATCRMYRSASEVFNGLLKNANEGIAAPVRIFVFSALLGVGHLLPLVLLAACFALHGSPRALNYAAAAFLCSLLPRLVAAWRFQQPLREALLHPVAILVLLGLQWLARYRELTGAPAVWKGRNYQPT